MTCLSLLQPLFIDYLGLCAHFDRGLMPLGFSFLLSYIPALPVFLLTRVMVFSVLLYNVSSHFSNRRRPNLTFAFTAVDQGAVCSLIVLFVIVSSWLACACRMLFFNVWQFLNLLTLLTTYMLVIGYACGLAVFFARLSKLTLVDPENLKQTKTNYLMY